MAERDKSGSPARAIGAGLIGMGAGMLAGREIHGMSRAMSARGVKRAHANALASSGAARTAGGTAAGLPHAAAAAGHRMRAKNILEQAVPKRFSGVRAGKWGAAAGVAGAAYGYFSKASPAGRLAKAFGLPNYGNPSYGSNQGAGAGQMLPDSRGRPKFHYQPLPAAAPNPTAPPNQLGTTPAQGQKFGFSSNQQDPRWDRARRIRAMPFIMAHQKFQSDRKQWARNPFASSVTKPIAPAGDAALSGYIGKAMLGGALAKFDEAKHPRAEDGKFTGGAGGDGEPRRAKGLAGLAPRLKLSSTFSQYRPDPNDKEWAGLPDEPLPATGTFARHRFTPYAPKALSAQEHQENARWAGELTTGLRETVITRGTNKGLIPPGTDPKDVRAAFNHARLVVLHDVGVGDYDFAFNEDAKARFRPLLKFMVFARRRMGNEIRKQKPGIWAPYKREFARSANPKKFYAQDNHGFKAGEEHKVFRRIDENALVKRVLTEAEHRQRQEAAKAAAEARRAKGGFGNRAVATWHDAAAWVHGNHADFEARHTAANEVAPFDEEAYIGRVKRNMTIGGAPLGRQLREAGVGALAGGAYVGPAGVSFGAQIGGYFATDKKRRDLASIEAHGGEGPALDHGGEWEQSRANLSIPLMAGTVGGLAAYPLRIASEAGRIKAAGHGKAWASAARMGAGMLPATMATTIGIGAYGSIGGSKPREESAAFDRLVTPSKEAVLGVGAAALAGFAGGPAMARTLTVRSRRAALRQAMREAKAEGTPIVYRGAPVADVAPISRSYGATYVARHKPVTYQYAGSTGTVARYRIKPGLKFVDLSGKHGDAQDLDMAQRLVFRQRAGRMMEGRAAVQTPTGPRPYQPPSRFAPKPTLADFRREWKDVRSLKFGSKAEEYAQPEEFRDLHWKPTPVQMKYLDRKGYAGTTAGRRNFALNDPTVLTYVAAAPRSTAPTLDRQIRRGVARGKRAIQRLVGVEKVADGAIMAASMELLAKASPDMRRAAASLGHMARA